MPEIAREKRSPGVGSGWLTVLQRPEIVDSAGQNQFFLTFLC
jgi:hypothetical protein